MKKTLITLMALTSVAMAADSRPYANYTEELKDSLVFAYSFDSSTSADYINTGVTVSGSFTTGGICTGEAPVIITNLNSSFTFSFKLAGATDLSTNGGSAYVTLYSDASTTGRDNCFYINHSNDKYFGVGDLGWGDATDWYWKYDRKLEHEDALGSVFILTWDDANKAVAFYVDGKSVDTFTSGSGTLQKITFATAGGTNNAGSVTFDNIALWSRVLTANEVKSLSVVPEPTTATLSLLALASLAARRRRR